MTKVVIEKDGVEDDRKLVLVVEVPGSVAELAMEALIRQLHCNAKARGEQGVALGHHALISTKGGTGAHLIDGGGHAGSGGVKTGDLLDSCLLAREERERRL